jgi:hypothetical protein
MALILASIAVFAFLILIFSLPSSIPGPSLSKSTNGHRLSISKLRDKLPSSSILNPFGPKAHAPPVQANSTSEEASWHSDWKWLSPFSSSVTLDENRSLLPPLPKRPPVYTYYDYKQKKDADLQEAEKQLLVTWRKAWRAQGFNPVILGPADAMDNPLYLEVQRMGLEGDIQIAMDRWLAWENMGTGILCDYLALPMGSHEDFLLSSLRRGEFRALTQYGGLGSGFFSGAKAEIREALKAALVSPIIRKSKTLVEAVSNSTPKIMLDSAPAAIAFYHTTVLKTKYGKVDEAFQESPSKGWKMLNQLINAHLHSTWQNVFSNGIVVLKPLPAHMTAVIEPALELAKFLSQCPESPIPASCPPNNPQCKPCVASTPMKISTPPQYRNISSQYTIGIVPHPYTFATLNSLRDSLDVPYIRRETKRDQYLSTITKELLGTGVSTLPRLVKFKEAVASPFGAAHSIWFPAEKPLPGDLDWHFGFAIPKVLSDTGKSETPVPGPERRPPPPDQDPQDGPKVDEKELLRERELLGKAKGVVTVKTKKNDAEMTKVRNAVEAWNLADSEAWKFANAFIVRNTMEREKWEEEERKFGGGVGAEGSSGRQGWSRWWDRGER